MGIEGNGFFAIWTARGTRYTRNGSFQVSSSGQLVTAAGDPVLGDPALERQRRDQHSGGSRRDRCGWNALGQRRGGGQAPVGGFAAGTKLTSEGGTLIAAPEGSAKPAQQSALRQGALEASNVNSISSVVTLIGVQRQAEMLQRALSLFDTEFNHIAATDLAKV